MGFGEVGHVEFPDEFVGGVVHHVDADALAAAVSLEPVVVGPVGALP